MTIDIKSLIKSPTSEVFRRAYIKRRNVVDGLFEEDWVEITSYIKKFGKVKAEIDSSRLNRFKFGNLKVVARNDEGTFNPHDNESSIWNGYLNEQRTLFKIEAGYEYHTQSSSGIWATAEFPSATRWDEALWDLDSSLFDNNDSSTVFKGVVSGDISLNGSNEVVLNIKPLVSVFQDYPAKNLTGWTTTGLTASQFVTMVRDQTDGSGNFIFRPFFDDTTSSWEISTTSNIYANLNTSTAIDVIDKNVWDVIEKLSEAENFVPYVTREGVFKFVSREPNTTGVSFEFHGAGSFNTEYGQTIKNISSYGRKLSKYYSRIQVKWQDLDTSSAYEIVEASFSVSPGSNPWVLGHRTFSIENFFIPTSTVANTIAQNIFDDYSSLKNEIEFTTSFIPHLEILDRFSIYYDPSEFNQTSLWDQANWAYDDTNLSTDLIFDNSKGDAIKLNGEEFKFLSVEIDIDNLENRFIAREV